MAYVQGQSSLSQSLTLLADGTLSVSVLAAQRNYGATNTQQVAVSWGGVNLGTLAPTGTSYQLLTTAPVSVSAGTADLTFAGLNPLSGDNTAFLDGVTVAFVPSGGGGAIGGSDDNPLRWLGGLGYWQGEVGGLGGIAGADSASGLGLTYVRQRWLDTGGDGTGTGAGSGTAQWMSVDPVDSEPRYSYAHNSPTIRTDASGTQVDGEDEAKKRDERIERREEKDLIKHRIDVSKEKANPDLKKLLKDFAQKARLAGQVGRYPFPSPGIFTISGSPWDEWNNDYSEADRVAIAKTILSPLESLMRISAKMNGIPMWLLSSVILAEMIDSHSLKEQLKRYYQLENVSRGPGQVQTDVAARKDDVPQELHATAPTYLVDVDDSDIRVLRDRMNNRNAMNTFQSGYNNASDEDARRQLTAELLDTAKYGVEACAREISKQLDRLLSYAIKIGLHAYSTLGTQQTLVPNDGVKIRSSLVGRHKGLPNSHTTKSKLDSTVPHSALVRICLLSTFDATSIIERRSANPNVIIDTPWVNDSIASVTSYGSQIRKKSAICALIHLLYNTPVALYESTANDWDQLLNNYEHGGGSMARRESSVVETLAVNNLFQS